MKKDVNRKVGIGFRRQAGNLQWLCIFFLAAGMLGLGIQQAKANSSAYDDVNKITIVFAEGSLVKYLEIQCEPNDTTANFTVSTPNWSINSIISRADSYQGVTGQTHYYLKLVRSSGISGETVNIKHKDANPRGTRGRYFTLGTTGADLEEESGPTFLRQRRKDLSALFKLDFNNTTDNNDTNSQPGFTRFIDANSGDEDVNGQTGVVVDLGGDIASLYRSDPNNTNDPCDPTFDPNHTPILFTKLYRDFIYGVGDPPGGVTMTVWGLGAGRDCNVVIYAFDSASTPVRRAEWRSNGQYLFTTDFNGTDPCYWPRKEDTYAWSAKATADDLGKITLTSSKDPCSPANQSFAYVNGLMVYTTGTYVEPKYAQVPRPPEGQEGVPIDTLLKWRKGAGVSKHDLYFGGDFNDVNTATRDSHPGVLIYSPDLDADANTFDPGMLELSTTYYWRVDENDTSNLWKGEVWSFTTYTPGVTASNPTPPEGATNVPADVTLGWTAGDYAATHDVYLGTDLAKVTDANRSNPMGVLVSEGQSATTYDPPGYLDSQTTYYWRVDEVNAAPYYTIFKGDVWNLRTATAPPSRTLEPPYEVGTWQGFKAAAVSYTFDDDCPNQLAVVVPMFDEPNFGYKLTLFTVTRAMNPNWPGLQNAAAEGHEVASHTETHATLSGGMNPSDLTSELAGSQSDIDANVPGQKCVTLAYPNCQTDSAVDANTALYYIGARVCSGSIVASTPANFYEISSFVCGGSGINTAVDFNSLFANTASQQGWCVLLMHAIDGDVGYSPISSALIRTTLEYLAANRSTFWVQTFGNITRYIKERNYVTVAETSHLGYRITLQVTDTLNNAIYNYPITLRRPLPDGWTSATVTQNGEPVDVCSLTIGSTNYIMFDVVPDGGEVVISTSTDPYSSPVDMNGLSRFCTYWLLNDCDATEGVDLNDDCLVNFYEYSFLARNWLSEAP